MKHPYLFLVDLFDVNGFMYHFAHKYPHVIYTWFVIGLLLVLGALAAKTVQMVPGKMQNFFELVVDGIENFMVDTIGEEGRWLFPFAATIFIFVFVGNLIGLIPGFYPPTATLNTTWPCSCCPWTVSPVWQTPWIMSDKFAWITWARQRAQCFVIGSKWKDLPNSLWRR